MSISITKKRELLKTLETFFNTPNNKKIFIDNKELIFSFLDNFDYVKKYSSINNIIVDLLKNWINLTVDNISITIPNFEKNSKEYILFIIKILDYMNNIDYWIIWIKNLINATNKHILHLIFEIYILLFLLNLDNLKLLPF